MTSVRLLALYLRQRPNVRSWDEALGGSEQFVIDYLASAVFENLPETLRRFLLRTSILDRVSGPLGDHLMDGMTPAGSVLLQQLEADGIFTSMLDEDGVWYRYHPLFRRTLTRILMAEVAPQEIAGLYERAATWHESQGWYEEAIGLLVSGKQVAAAAAVAGRHRHELLDRQDYHRLEHWLTLFPADAVLGEIELLFIKAYVDQVQFRIHDLTMILQQIDTLLSVIPVELPQIGEWRGEVASLRALITSFRSDGSQTLTLGLYALEHIRPGSVIARAMALLHTAYGYHMSGELQPAYELLDASANTTLIARDIAVLRSRTLRLYVDLVAGDLMAMRNAFPRIIDLAKSASLATTAAWAHYFYASACYLQNDLAAAEQHFAAVVGLELSAHSLCYVHSAIGLALTHQAQGRPDVASRAIVSAREYALRMQNRDLSEIVDAAVAELEVRQGY
ncbi:MAG: hypothetical protein IPK16_28280 [Anaerolineales bacterium]|nr:hypothetical protein [Anaerolineales bacterium]